MNARTRTLVAPQKRPKRLTETIRAPQLVWRPIPWWKRSIDIVVSAGLLLMLAPVLAIIAVYIRAVSRGPSIFKQQRLGEMGEYFTIYKFRTMHPIDPQVATSRHREYISSLTDSDAAIAKPDFANRLILGGQFLRRTSLDELPQLFNVLLGSMSLIGPRPDVLHWGDYTDAQVGRFEVRPGITGLWQVSGKNRLTFAQMMELDAEYVARRSFWFDMWIAWKTVKLILSNDNC